MYTSSVHSYLRSISTAEAPGWFYLDWILYSERFGISIWIIIHRLYILGIHPPSILTYGPFRRRRRPVGFIWIDLECSRDFHFIWNLSNICFYLIILPGFRGGSAPQRRWLFTSSVHSYLRSILTAEAPRNLFKRQWQFVTFYILAFESHIPEKNWFYFSHYTYISPSCLYCHTTVLTRLYCTSSWQHRCGAEEARRAHNPEVICSNHIAGIISIRLLYQKPVV